MGRASGLRGEPWLITANGWGSLSSGRTTMASSSTVRDPPGAETTAGMFNASRRISSALLRSAAIAVSASTKAVARRPQCFKTFIDSARQFTPAICIGSRLRAMPATDNHTNFGRHGMNEDRDRLCETTDGSYRRFRRATSIIGASRKSLGYGQRRRANMLRSVGVALFGSVHSILRITVSSFRITRLPSARLSSCSPVTRLWRTLPGILLTRPLDGRKTILSCHRTTV